MYTCFETHTLTDWAQTSQPIHTLIQTDVLNLCKLWTSTKITILDVSNFLWTEVPTTITNNQTSKITILFPKQENVCRIFTCHWKQALQKLLLPQFFESSFQFSFLFRTITVLALPTTQYYY